LSSALSFVRAFVVAAAAAAAAAKHWTTQTRDGSTPQKFKTGSKQKRFSVSGMDASDLWFERAAAFLGERQRSPRRRRLVGARTHAHTHSNRRRIDGVVAARCGDAATAAAGGGVRRRWRRRRRR
jgi:hypothetical protein